MKIGILAVQGAFAEHQKMLQKLGADTFQIRQKADLNQSMQGLILPGGESTVMGKLIRELDMYDEIHRRITGGLPVFGTCAGLLLLAGEISNDSRTYLGTMKIKACRNAYGRQLGSFQTQADFKGIGTVPMTFVRAPFIEAVEDQAEVLAVVEERIVAARQGNQLVTAFHPELNTDTAIHEYFLELCKKNR